MEKSSISVKIYNDTYVLRTAASEENVKAVAGEVDARMKRLSEAKNIQSDVEKLAVWTALDLAAELLDLKKRYDRLCAAIREG